MTTGQLRDLRSAALSLRTRLDRVIAQADTRLGGADSSGADIAAPLNTDWTWRPEPWCAPIRPSTINAVTDGTEFGAQATLFHDAADAQILLRQLPATAPDASAPFLLTLAAYDFGGSFLSLVFDLPEAASAGLNRRYVVRLDPKIEAEQSTEIFARLNVRHGPNTENIVRELPMDQDDKSVEFDLAYTKLNEKRVDRMWLDLIIGQPGMNKVTVHDLAFSRRPRAEI